MYNKIGSKFKRKYGKTISELSKELNVSTNTIFVWEYSGFDIYEKSKEIEKKRHESIHWHKYLNKCWENICSRCGNPNDKKFEYYGGKGIKVKLSKIELLLLWNRDEGWKLKNPSIDRIDSNGNYEFNNCRFIEMEENRIKK